VTQIGRDCTAKSVAYERFQFPRWANLAIDRKHDGNLPALGRTELDKTEYMVGDPRTSSF
jgi:hypothetical protein